MQAGWRKSTRARHPDWPGSGLVRFLNPHGLNHDRWADEVIAAGASGEVFFHSDDVACGRCE
jgi:hypothetical protein